MGLADIIPGVSGGTMALITGIYERLIFGIKNIGLKFVYFALKGDFKSAKQDLQAIDFPFFIPLLAGIALSFLLFSRVIDFLLDFYPLPMFAFFFGLILASAKIVFKRIKTKQYSIYFWILIGFLFSFAFTFLNPVQANHSMPVVFFSGMIAICAMLLPGISGAFILLFLGQYEFLLNALHSLNFLVIALFGLGALIGLALFSRLLAFLLKRNESAVLAVLTGLMLGALGLLVKKMSEVNGFNALAENNLQILLVLLAVSAGIGIALFLEKIANKRKHKGFEYN